jgi:hypothetical protein
MLGRVDDDLLPLERGVEVRHDADSPGVADPKRLRRRSIFPAGAKRAALELVLRCGLDLGQPRTRASAAPRRDQNAAPGERILADACQVRSPLPASINGLKSSIGIGRMSVDERSELISSIVWRKRS